MTKWTILGRCDGRPLLETLFTQRGLAGSFEDYIHPPMSGLEPPARLKDIDKAATRIKLAVACREPVTIYGDYDVDGITSVAIMVRYLRAQGANVDWYIPDRKGEGYGLHAEAVEALAARGTKLIVTVDTGITSFQAVERATALGVDVVITDHHAVRDTLPDACAVVNPQRSDCASVAGLAGVGVAFQLLRYMAGTDNDESTMTQYGLPAALGTVADIMPMGVHNRTLVRHGLAQLDGQANAGLRALVAQSGVGKRLNVTAVGFGLAPRINAAGRMGMTHLAVELLLTDDAKEADRLAEALCQLNRERQNVEGGLLEQALEQAEQQKDSPVLVLTGHDWHAGVVGIVASRVCDRTGKPAFLISVENGRGKGSSRAPKGFHLVEALAANAPLLLNYGGHESAAGFAVEEQDIDALADGLRAFAEQQPPLHAQGQLVVDLQLTPDEVTLKNAYNLQLAEPFGTDNLLPCFCLLGVKLAAVQEIGNGKHLRVTLCAGSASINGVWFGKTADALGFEAGDLVDVAFHLEVNNFRNTDNVQLLLVDMRADASHDGYAALCEGRALDDEQQQALGVTRSEVGRVWRTVLAMPSQGWSIKQLCRQAGIESPGKGKLMLDILQQMGLLSWRLHGDAVDVAPVTGKSSDLDKSAYWRVVQKEVTP